MKKVETTPKSNMSIGELSRHAGCKVVTIRYYERIGILPAPPRSDGGYRLYEADHLKRLSFVRRSRELGFSLEQVRGLLGLVDGGDHTCGEVKAITVEHLEEVRVKITDLKRLELVLKEMASKCEGGTVPECPILDALFQGG